MQWENSLVLPLMDDENFCTTSVPSVFAPNAVLTAILTSFRQEVWYKSCFNRL